LILLENGYEIPSECLTDSRIMDKVFRGLERNVSGVKKYFKWENFANQMSLKNCGKTPDLTLRTSILGNLSVA